MSYQGQTRSVSSALGNEKLLSASRATNIIVTLPGTNFNVTYERSSNGAALVARSFGGQRDEGDKS